MKMLKKILLFSTLIFLLSCVPPAPVVVSTSPADGAAVDSSLEVISVTFSRPMLDNSWSWVYESKDTFPMTVGEPYYDSSFTTNHLPVKLEPQKEYVIWINRDEFMNFRDKSGRPVEPHRFTFSTE